MELMTETLTEFGDRIVENYKARRGHNAHRQWCIKEELASSGHCVGCRRWKVEPCSNLLWADVWKYKTPFED